MAGKFVGTTYTGDETDETVNGTAADETILGGNTDVQGTGSDTLRGGGGDDNISPGSSLFGSVGVDGIDRLFGDAGDDTLYNTPLATKGSLLDGGAGTGDKAVVEIGYLEPAEAAKVPQIVFALNQNGSFVTVGGKQTLFVKAVESLNFSTNTDRAVITGGAEVDFLNVRGYGATLKGLGGNDSLYAYLKTDFLVTADGGAGTSDTVTLLLDSGDSETGSALPLVMGGNLQTGAAVRSGSKVLANLRGIEGVSIFAGAGDDVLFGGTGFNSLGGGLGKNVLRGNVGADSFTLTLDAKLDTVVGSGGSDSLTLFAPRAANGSLSSEDVVMTGSLDRLTVKLGTATGVSATGLEGVTITSGNGDDTLFGGTLRDTFNVAAGANTVRAGDGDDAVTLNLDAPLDQVAGGGGVDTLTISSPRFDGFDQAITMTAGGPNGFDMKFGGKLALRVSGMEKLEMFDGSSKDDVLIALSGDSSLRGDAGNDKITGRGGNDRLDGGSGDDRLEGGAGDDALTAGGGKDTLIGGLGTDTAFLSGDTGFGVTLTLVTGRAANATSNGKTVATLSGIENLSGTFGDDKLTGDSGDNSIVGSGGSNTLDGGAGRDTASFLSDSFSGGRGLTIALKGAQASTVTRFDFDGSVQGTDTIRNFENVVGSGAGDVITGDGAANELTGGGGLDTLRGGGGGDTLRGGGLGAFSFSTEADIMEGGTGNDTYYVDNVLDTVKEAKGQGVDTVIADGTGYTLARGQEIEVLKVGATPGFFFSTSATLGGNEFANRIIGGTSADTLSGGGGADTFVFETKPSLFGRDAITDFNVRDDSIALDREVFAVRADPKGRMVANQFKDIGTGKIDGDDRILYHSKTGDLFYDSDGAGKTEAVLLAHLDNLAKLGAADFLVA